MNSERLAGIFSWIVVALLIFFIITLVSIPEMINNEDSYVFHTECVVERCFIVDKRQFNVNNNCRYIVIIKLKDRIASIEGIDYFNNLKIQTYYEANILKIYKGKEKLVDEKILSISY